jgi:hypothetical protein
MKKIHVIILLSSLYACNTPKPTNDEAPAKPRAVELADEKYIDIGQKSLTQLAEGNVDGFVADFADNAVFQWSAGDSLANKEAIIAYWKDRRANVIDTISYDGEIWLPVKANQGPPTVGVWLLNWANFTVRYNNGKTLKMSIHHAFHFDNTDKIDNAVQYVDRAPIAAALQSK